MLRALETPHEWRVRDGLAPMDGRWVGNSNPASSPEPKPAASATSEMLTPCELELLRAAAKETGDVAREAFANYRKENTQDAT